MRDAHSFAKPMDGLRERSEGHGAHTGERDQAAGGGIPRAFSRPTSPPTLRPTPERTLNSEASKVAPASTPT
jgi:hypothetical protein